MPPLEGVGCDEGLEVVQRPAIQGVCIRRQAATLPAPAVGPVAREGCGFLS